MKQYRLKVANGAEKSADAIFDWLAERSPEGAANWYRAYLQAIDSLKVNPERRAPALEANSFSLVVRQILFKTQHGRLYRILFVVKDETVYIVGVRGRGQDSAEPDDLDLPH